MKKPAKKIQQENDTYLDLFETDLLASGLFEKTVYRHLKAELGNSIQ